MARVKQFNLPDPGEGLTEAEIVTWKVKVGDTVKVNDIVVEIETAKSLVELPVPYAGTVTDLLVPEGETVDGRHADHRGRHRRRRRPARGAGTGRCRAATRTRRSRPARSAAPRPVAGLPCWSATAPG